MYLLRQSGPPWSGRWKWSAIDVGPDTHRARSNRVTLVQVGFSIRPDQVGSGWLYPRFMAPTSFAGTPDSGRQWRPDITASMLDSVNSETSSHHEVILKVACRQKIRFPN